MSLVRIAHLSDPHVLDLSGVPTRRLVFNKRITGWINLGLKRASHHKFWVLEAMMDDLRTRRVDHVVVTGDLTNLALDPEFERARTLLERMGYGPDALSVIPGNHDVYTAGAERARRFARYFAPYITSDVEVEGAGHRSGPFPFVRLRGAAAIVGLSTAVARLPLVASGSAGAPQIAALARVLQHPEVRKRTPVLLTHHPITNPRSLLGTVLRGWSEVGALRAVLPHDRDTLALHGHLHHRVHERIATRHGATIHRLGATSASLLNDDPHAMAGYNLYEVSSAGLVSARARVYDSAVKGFVERGLPGA
jgi:3',5'-cyclic AMP phosphodiesterase CpdA